MLQIAVLVLLHLQFVRTQGSCNGLQPQDPVLDGSACAVVDVGSSCTVKCAAGFGSSTGQTSTSQYTCQSNGSLVGTVPDCGYPLSGSDGAPASSVFITMPCGGTCSLPPASSLNMSLTSSSAALSAAQGVRYSLAYGCVARSDCSRRRALLENADWQWLESFRHIKHIFLVQDLNSQKSVTTFVGSNARSASNLLKDLVSSGQVPPIPSNALVTIQNSPLPPSKDSNKGLLGLLALLLLIPLILCCLLLLCCCLKKQQKKKKRAEAVVSTFNPAEATVLPLPVVIEEDVHDVAPVFTTVSHVDPVVAIEPIPHQPVIEMHHVVPEIRQPSLYEENFVPVAMHAVAYPPVADLQPVPSGRATDPNVYSQWNDQPIHQFEPIQHQQFEPIQPLSAYQYPSPDHGVAQPHVSDWADVPSTDFDPTTVHPQDTYVAMPQKQFYGKGSDRSSSGSPPPPHW